MAGATSSGRHRPPSERPTRHLRRVRTAVRMAPALGDDVEPGAALLRALPAQAVPMSNRSRRPLPARSAGSR